MLMLRFKNRINRRSYIFVLEMYYEMKMIKVTHYTSTSYITVPKYEIVISILIHVINERIK